MPGGNCAARRSISAMASPELRPGAAWPRMLAAGTPLKRSRRGEPRVHSALEKALNGTMSPLALRTYQRSRSSGSMRNGASPCTNTFLVRPFSMKSLT